ncbi:MAG TPA: DUF3253 domain-containing protein [Acidocella sp.]|jgi:hypothetical protein|nr:MAG: hypothetical protein B7Z77_01920 [Acidocella sp. 20-58-15]HQT39847.1 DUF3253 domain-containing protein [Acidocella sp.]
MSQNPTGKDPAEQAILALVTARGPDKSICPTEAARALAGNPPDEKWRASLSPIRLAAQRLAKAGKIQILRKGKPVAPEDARGVIRLRIAPSGD